MKLTSTHATPRIPRHLVAVLAALVAWALMPATRALAETGFGNHGYPYGTAMSSSSIALAADVVDASGATYQWQYSSSGTAEWTEVDGASGSVDDATTLAYALTPVEGRWYRCALVSGGATVASEPVMAHYNSNRWYLSNGQMAYAVWGGLRAVGRPALTS